MLFGKEVSRDCIKVTALINIRYVAHRVTELMRMRSAGHVAPLGVIAYRDLSGKPEGNRPLSRPRRRWEGHHRHLPR